MWAEEGATPADRACQPHCPQGGLPTAVSPPEGPAAAFGLQTMEAVVPGGALPRPEEEGACRRSRGSGPGASLPSLSRTPLGDSWEGGSPRTPSPQSQLYGKQQDTHCSGKLCGSMREGWRLEPGPLLPTAPHPGGRGDHPPRTQKDRASVGRSSLPVQGAGSLALWWAGLGRQPPPAGLVAPGSADPVGAHLLHTAPSSALLTKCHSVP